MPKSKIENGKWSEKYEYPFEMDHFQFISVEC